MMTTSISFDLTKKNKINIEVLAYALQHIQDGPTTTADGHTLYFTPMNAGETVMMIAKVWFKLSALNSRACIAERGYNPFVIEILSVFIPAHKMRNI